MLHFYVLLQTDHNKRFHNSSSNPDLERTFFSVAEKGQEKCMNGNLTNSNVFFYVTHLVKINYVFKQHKKFNVFIRSAYFKADT